ncbi:MULTISPECIES: DUF3017 domain-containing protein [Streptomyces]|uniref:DUF3017 domain-containing protein n=1 Tax=Streptomyces TaxID=1883 RepID=UPI00287FE21A|nr:DUF3017 domain-containing protein [Streptomyces sp. CGMCC 4.1456]WNF64567.1 DUF3017 domain-containing protein [Streptomyces sp. CGMCC 4.1456]
MSAERSARSAAGGGSVESARAGLSADAAEAGRGVEDGQAGPSASGDPDGHVRRTASAEPDAQAGPSTPDGPDGPEAGEDGLTVRDPVSAPDAEGRPRRVTRRFPLFTKDTARPEGGGRAVSGDAPAPVRQWPVLAVLGLVGLGLLVTAFDQFRLGTLLIGVALLGSGVMRWLLPDVGMLAVRSRFTDMVTYGGLGLVIVLLALMAQPEPWLQIPFLKDTLHFTVTSG